VAHAVNYNIPEQYEPQIQEVARAQHISERELLDRIFKAGLEQFAPMSVSPRDILGAFSSKEESAIADEALDLAMKDRLRRNSQAPHA
jgi:hypothetical protein